MGLGWFCGSQTGLINHSPETSELRTFLIFTSTFYGSQSDLWIVDVSRRLIFKNSDFMPKLLQTNTMSHTLITDRSQVSQFETLETQDFPLTSKNRRLWFVDRTTERRCRLQMRSKIFYSGVFQSFPILLILILLRFWTILSWTKRLLLA